MKTTFQRLSLAALTLAGAVSAGCGGGASSSEQSTTAANTQSQPQTNTQSAGGEAPTFPMPLPDFLGAVTVEVLPELCSDASPLRTCYPSIDAELCANAFGTAMMVCGENMQSTLPAEVTEESADPVATAVATCARIAYQAGLEQAGIVRATDCPLAR
jgi:hypothetical protein